VKCCFVGGPAHGQALEVGEDIVRSGYVCIRQPGRFRILDINVDLCMVPPEPIHRYRVVRTGRVSFIFVHEDCTDDQGIDFAVTTKEWVNG
jgi:hypothetical protein